MNDRAHLIRLMESDYLMSKAAKPLTRAVLDQLQDLELLHLSPDDHSLVLHPDHAGVPFIRRINAGLTETRFLGLRVVFDEAMPKEAHRIVANVNETSGKRSEKDE